MSSESKPVDPAAEAVAKEAVSESTQTDEAQDGSDFEEVPELTPAEAAAKKKKKGAKKKLKQVIPKSPDNAGEGSSSGSKPGTKDEVIAQLMKSNPALQAEIAKNPSQNRKNIEKMLKNMSLGDLLTGMAVTGKNQKDMASYKFWQTQPVPSFDDKSKGQVEEGPIKIIDPERVPKEPAPLPDGFEWVTMDLENKEEIQEVFELLTHHYVEDDEAMFRFNYSTAFFDWALKAPGWLKEWHIGVRAKMSRKLVAFISGIPMSIRVRDKTLACSDINFMCVHKKLRSKRLAPVLIREVTRRCYLKNIFQAIYTAGVVLPTPVTTCRYFHRSLDWEKLYSVGFSPLPPGQTVQRQIARYLLPKKTATPNLRPMESKDIDPVLDLLKRYLARVDLAQNFTREEVDHWLLHKGDAKDADRVVWSYVVEDPESGKITDFFSFYCLESTVIGKNKVVRAAYLYYYATETAFKDDRKTLKVRLNMLIKDALILAKLAKFEVMNALTLLDNPLFLEEQKFGAGDGQLHYYLYNYRANHIKGGIDAKNRIDDGAMGGVGVVML